MQEIMQQVGALLLGAMPTALLFIVLVLAYEFLVQGPLTAVLKERRARTEGAVHEAHQAIARAEARAEEYAARLRQARSEVYKAREERIRQWMAERDAALESARKAASAKVGEAKTKIESETVAAREGMQAAVAELASQIVRVVMPAAAGGSR
jgi:F-type H+-transporting ATPase subunit b